MTEFDKLLVSKSIWISGQIVRIPSDSYRGQLISVFLVDLFGMAYEHS